MAGLGKSPSASKQGPEFYDAPDPDLPLETREMWMPPLHRPLLHSDGSVVKWPKCKHRRYCVLQVFDARGLEDAGRRFFRCPFGEVILLQNYNAFVIFYGY